MPSAYIRIEKKITGDGCMVAQLVIKLNYFESKVRIGRPRKDRHESAIFFSATLNLMKTRGSSLSDQGRGGCSPVS